MTDNHGVARDQLRAFIERVERLEEEKKTIADDIKDVYGEAKAMGFNTKIMKTVIGLRKKDDQQRTEEELILDTYLSALGMIPQFELFEEAESPAQQNKPAMALQSPRQAAEAVSERTATTDERNVEATVEQRSSAPMVEADKAEAEAGVSGQPEVIPALTVQHDGVNVSGPERADVTVVGTESGTVAISEIEIPSADERQSPDDGMSGEGTNTGGDNVDRSAMRAGHADQASNTGEDRQSLPTTITYEDFPPESVKKSSFGHCFPELSARDYDALGASIAFKGVLEPIVRQGSVIIDGWARYNIARNLGIQYPVVEYDGDDALLDVIAWQSAARNFTPAQSKKIAADLAKEVPHRASEIMAAFSLVVEEEAA